ncbi:MAG: TraB/GumN family protein [Nitrospirales bacterium]|nr:MAG: TraB/GumN family protein [Nitrospirales bacterium]
MRCSQRTAFLVRLALLTLSLQLLVPQFLLAQNVEQDKATSCLWSITAGDTTIYLLGSIHVLKEEHYPLHNAIYQAFRAASHLVFEVNLDEISSPVAQRNSLTKGLFTDGRTLQEVLTPENFAFTKTQLKKLGYGIELFGRMKPWMLATTITLLELQKLGFETGLGVDQHIFQQAKAQGKTIEGLETIDDQLNLFDGLASHSQEQYLLHTLAEIDSIKQRTQSLIDSWTNGEIEGLQATLDNMKILPDVYDALIIRRNNNWLPQVESYLQNNETTMIVVGTLHLIGEHGLLARLKEKGYVIKQL